jgi:hypothetical protein
MPYSRRDPTMVTFRPYVRLEAALSVDDPLTQREVEVLRHVTSGNAKRRSPRSFRLRKKPLKPTWDEFCPNSRPEIARTQ